MTRSAGHRDSELVLVVDDSVFERAVAREALEEAEFGVIEAEDGTSGLAFFRSALPDLVLLDVKMPGMDGFELCARLRSLPEGEHVPVVMMTGLDDVNSIERAYDAGATDFFTKPINPAILRHRIRYLLRGQRMADALRQSEARLANAKRLARLGHWEWNVDTSRVQWSPEIEVIFGASLADDCGIYDAMAPFLQKVDAARLVQALEVVLRRGEPATLDHAIRRPDGSTRVIHQEIEAADDGADDAVLRIVGTAQDITDRVDAEQRIRYLAYYDSVTDLPNRTLLKEHLERCIGLADRNGDIGAVLFLDLDHFKHINDTCGHDTGDRFLKEVARRLCECIHGCEQHPGRLDAAEVESPEPLAHCVARLGGDEFVIALSRMEDSSVAQAVAERIQAALKAPVFVDGRELYATGSIGISVFPVDGRNADTLLRNADMAMYHAKSLGRNCFHAYTQSLNDRIQQRMSLETSLRAALADEQFVLHYQPRIDVTSRHVVGLEALIRWEHPQRGLVSPAEFIPVAEETGLIVPLGEWVLETACRQARQWHERGLATGRVSVNVSAAQFGNPRLRSVVARTLRITEVPPELIELELTESALMDNAEESAGLLGDLKSLGVSISVDDFGTGYSSLSYLKRFPIDVLKIDRTFVRDISRDADDAAIVSMTIMLGHALRLSVVAEGVEDEDQLAFLRERGCNACQGYLFAPPLPVAKLEDWLEQHRSSGEASAVDAMPQRPRMVAG